MATERTFDVFQVEAGTPVKAWTRGVAFEDQAKRQVENVARMPFVGPWVAVMPDVHAGAGATIGSVIPTERAIIPAAVGVDIGCGMIAARTTLRAVDLPGDLSPVRAAIEAEVPRGRSHNGGPGDIGGWAEIPPQVTEAWQELAPGYAEIIERHPKLRRANSIKHLGTLGTGNHFIEVCLDDEARVWLMLHSGSRGIGNRIGSYFIELAKQHMRRWMIDLPDTDLAYLPEGEPHFTDYLKAARWAQEFARLNRELMLGAVLRGLAQAAGLPSFDLDGEAINCHHNYVSKEHHARRNLWITRKGAVRARAGELGIIPGSMGARSYIVRGKGNPESFESCSHGAGRAMSRTEARRRFTVADHEAATAGVECRKDADVIDETPGAYKSIDAVMQAQADLVEVVHTLRQVICIKG